MFNSHLPSSFFLFSQSTLWYWGKETHLKFKTVAFHIREKNTNSCFDRRSRSPVLYSFRCDRYCLATDLTSLRNPVRCLFVCVYKIGTPVCDLWLSFFWYETKKNHLNISFVNLWYSPPGTWGLRIVFYLVIVKGEGPELLKKIVLVWLAT